MEGVEHGFGVTFRNAKQGAGGAFRAAMALLPILQRAGADAHERCKLALAEAKSFAHSAGVGPFQCGFARRLFSAAQDCPAFLEAGCELLE